MTAVRHTVTARSPLPRNGGPPRPDARPHHHARPHHGAGARPGDGARRGAGPPRRAVPLLGTAAPRRGTAAGRGALPHRSALAGCGGPPGPPAPDRALLALLGVLAVLALCTALPHTAAGAAAGRGRAASPAAGGVPADAARAWPVAGPVRVLQGFRPPPLPWAAGHRGADLAAPEGSEVRAAAAGTVAFAGRVGGRSAVTVVHPGTGEPPLRTTYLPVEPVLPVGARVEAGEVVGRLEAARPAADRWSGDPRAGDPRPEPGGPPRTGGPPGPGGPPESGGPPQVGDGHCTVACLHWGLLRGRRYLDPLALLGLGTVRLLPSEPAATGPRAAPETVHRGRGRGTGFGGAGGGEPPGDAGLRRAGAPVRCSTSGPGVESGAPGGAGRAACGASRGTARTAIRASRTRPPCGRGGRRPPAPGSADSPDSRIPSRRHPEPAVIRTRARGHPGPGPPGRRSPVRVTARRRAWRAAAGRPSCGSG
ncbi:peptidoglycan DD-metalloendopeptidase family protein [Streptomyces sp. NPDC001380]|uniref:peptidoglycan DD-metalloendopeptidase family protein n=1 Tax=Streptomyces sp. NPDC001380 TaxID=3364566 RepID=UPI0036BAFCF3